MYICSTLDELSDYAKRLTEKILGFEGSCIIFLRGDLGAGKTTLVQNILHHLGYNGLVTSPTFAVINEYSFDEKLVAHIDLYRIHDEEELDFLGLDVVFENSNIVFIEWPEKLKGIEAHIDISIVLNGEKRQILEHFNTFE